jgi:hypothetical protein
MSKSANRHAQSMVAFHRNEMKMLDKIDRRKKSGKGNEDDDHANTHMTVSKEGTRTWTY